jgi:hypothetical protein
MTNAVMEVAKVKKSDQLFRKLPTARSPRRLVTEDKIMTDEEFKALLARLSDKFGGFTEGLALPSMTKILREKFKMEVISPSVRVSKNGIDAEIDVLAYSNSSINEAYVVEVKSHLREEAITQLNTLMGNFRALFPEHNDKKLYGIIAAMDMSEMLKKRVLEAGFYVARIQDETFSLDTPNEFQAKCF